MQLNQPILTGYFILNVVYRIYAILTELFAFTLERLKIAVTLQFFDQVFWTDIGVTNAKILQMYYIEKQVYLLMPMDCMTLPHAKLPI